MLDEHVSSNVALLLCLSFHSYPKALTTASLCNLCEKQKCLQAHLSVGGNGSHPLHLFRIQREFKLRNERQGFGGSPVDRLLRTLPGDEANHVPLLLHVHSHRFILEWRCRCDMRTPVPLRLKEY